MLSACDPWLEVGLESFGENLEPSSAPGVGGGGSRVDGA